MRYINYRFDKRQRKLGQKNFIFFCLKCSYYNSLQFLHTKKKIKHINIFLSLFSHHIFVNLVVMSALNTKTTVESFYYDLARILYMQQPLYYDIIYVVFMHCTRLYVCNRFIPLLHVYIVFYGVLKHVSYLLLLNCSGCINHIVIVLFYFYMY